MVHNDIENDIKFKQGRKCFADGNYEGAVEFFSELLQSSSEKYSEQSIELAPIWYEYGNSLLAKEEDNPTDSLLGTAANDAQQQRAGQIVDNSDNNDNGSDDEEDNEATISAEDQAVAPEDNENASDMEIAWEALEMSRMIYEQHPSIDSDRALAEVHNRLGDLSRFNGNYNQAIEEYLKSLNILQSITSDTDRRLSACYYNLAVAYIYNSSDVSQDSHTMKSKALSYYQKAKEVISNLLASTKTQTDTTATNNNNNNNINNNNSNNNNNDNSMINSTDSVAISNSSSSTSELQEIVDELAETIEALQSELSEAVAEASSDQLHSSSSSSGGGTTTVGFGTSSSSASTGYPSNNISNTARSSTGTTARSSTGSGSHNPFSFSSTSTTAAVGHLITQPQSLVTNVLQAKKKIKTQVAASDVIVDTATSTSCSTSTKSKDPTSVLDFVKESPTGASGSLSLSSGPDGRGAKSEIDTSGDIKDSSSSSSNKRSRSNSLDFQN